jgi:hypothetical protein
MWFVQKDEYKREDKYYKAEDKYGKYDDKVRQKVQDVWCLELMPRAMLQLTTPRRVSEAALCPWQGGGCALLLLWQRIVVQGQCSDRRSSRSCSSSSY